MKTRLLSFFLIIALVQGACALVGGSEDTTPPTATTPAATQAPVATQPATQPATTPAQPGPTATQPPPTPTRPPAEPGPESLDLSDPALFQHTLTDYTDQLANTIEGTDSAGADFNLRMGLVNRFQSQPSPAWYTKDNLSGEEFTIEKAAVDGALYTLQEGSDCSQTSAGAPPKGTFGLLASVLTGQAARAETGVEINGMVTDRYDVQAENLIPNAEITIQEITIDGDSTLTSTVTIRLGGVGSLWRAQEGGFAVRLELTETKTATEDDFMFTPGSEMVGTHLFELIPTPAGTPPIAPPAGCQGGGAGGEVSFPKMDDASILVEDAEQLSYQTNHTLDDVHQFYLDEMPAAGWTLSDESNIGSIIEMTFTKDGQEATVTLLQTGTSVTVTIMLT